MNKIISESEFYSIVMENAKDVVYYSKYSGPYQIIDFTLYGVTPALDKVRFLNTGTELWFPRGTVISGYVKDPCTRDKYGIGYMGVGPNGATIIDSWGRNRKSPAYTTWRAMIWRCYAKGDGCYKGVTVCERWHNFQWFCEDIKKLDGYQNWVEYHAGIRPNGIMELDKDYKARPGEPKQYSPETCCFLTKRDNLRVRWNRPIHPAGVFEVSDYKEREAV